YRDLFDDLRKQGFLRARVDGRIVQLTDEVLLEKQMKHTIDVIVDRLQSGAGVRSRLAEAVESALRLGKGRLLVAVERGEPARRRSRAANDEVTSESLPVELQVSGPDAETLYSTQFACVECGISYEPPSPQLFSFNSPLGMCPQCNGLGMRFE